MNTSLHMARSKYRKNASKISTEESDRLVYANASISSYDTDLSSATYLLSNFAKDRYSTFLEKPVDVPVDAVVTSIYFNSAAFVFLMIIYECLRRTFPSVYSARQRLNHMRPINNNTKDNNPLISPNQKDNYEELDSENFKGKSSHKTRRSCTTREFERNLKFDSSKSLPDIQPLDWLRPVLGVSWPTVLECAGLDGYFFLRYIRICVRITSVSSFWFCLILIPIYATGNNSSDTATGLYYLSSDHIPANGWRMWIACLFAYLFSFFIFFVINQEYRHFLEVRQEFLSKGSIHVNPQNQYSIIVESIPYELRSNRALADYFNTLFPGKVHSASVVLKLPDLEKTSNICLRSCRRLEKCIALLQATGKRPTHFIHRGCIEISPMGCPVETFKICGREGKKIDNNSTEVVDSMEENAGPILEKPTRGKRVDSIVYYTHELALNSRALYRMQQHKAEIADSGNQAFTCNNWLDSALQGASILANLILDESALDNALVTSNDNFVPADNVERVSSQYGAIDQNSFGDSSCQSRLNGFQTCSGLVEESQTIPRDTIPLLSPDVKENEGLEDRSLLMRSVIKNDESKLLPRLGSDRYGNATVRILGRLGLDFFIFIARLVRSQLDSALEGVLAETMSSTGMVTFLDLSSVACAASAPLTVKASVLDVSGAPEPREIIWGNAHVSKTFQAHRELISNAVLLVGVLFWSFPLALIQAVAKIDVIAQIPGLEWLRDYDGGEFSNFVNGYLPVVALLSLIMILPVIFEYIAVKFEQRKTLSDVQASILGRYFNYQLVNIYVTVTAGSLLRKVADIVDHPLEILTIGAGLPSMAGYFLALLVTKILSGLPMVFLRFGDLGRMIWLLLFSNEKKITQREIDAAYRLENVQYGWEFPTQLLVVVIVFTYAIMCPIILPVGMIYFSGALTVYKKQILYVYSPVYESGGAMFPPAVQKTLFGLVCSQITFLGYIVSRGCHPQPMFLAPLPVITVWVSNYFKRTFADPSEKLSLERARAVDSIVEKKKRIGAKGLDKHAGHGFETKFDKLFYRQPVLTEAFREPWTYRRGIRDKETNDVREELLRMNRAITQTQMKGIVASMKGLNSRTIGLKPNLSA